MFDLHGVHGAIEGLVARGLLARRNARLDAGPSLRGVVQHLLLLDRVVVLSAGSAAPSLPSVRADVLVLKASSGALLLLEPYAHGFVHWAAPSAAAARALAASFLSGAGLSAQARDAESA